MTATHRWFRHAFTMIAPLLVTTLTGARAGTEQPTAFTKAVAAAADDVVQVIRERREAGEALTPEFMTLESQALRRKVLCDLAAAADQRQRVEVARKYVDQASDQRRLVGFWEGCGQSYPQAHLLEYFFHESELWLAKVSAGEIVADTGDVPRQDREPPQNAGEAEQRAKVALRDAAREVLTSLKQRLDAGEALTPEFVELHFQASRRLCEAEREVDPSRPATLKALRAHLGRAKDLYTLLDQRFKAGIDVSRVQVSQGAYYVEEAKLWLVRAEGK